MANSADKKGMGDNLGWFPFPSVAGGAGDANDGLGGGNGFAVGKDAPPETVDFLHFLVSKDAANRWGALNTGILPTTVGTESSVTDPQLTSVLDARAKANFVQLYLDQATTPGAGRVHQRRGRDPVRRIGHAGVGRSGDRDRRQDPVVATERSERRTGRPPGRPVRYRR